MQFNHLISVAIAASTYLLPTANAAVNSGCSFSTTTISQSADVASLNACPTLDGTIEITGDEIVSLQLPSVQEIDGDINIFNSSSINNINLNQLSSINGSLSITALTALASIDFTSLENVEDLELISLPSLSLVTFLKGLQTVNDLQLSDTALQTIQGFNTFDTVNILNINNNKNISTIDLPLQTVTNTLLISFNNDHAEIVLDDLIWASNLTIQDVESISAQNLTAVNGSLIIAYNIFDTLALDNLTAVGGSVEIFANDELTDLSLSDLSTIGGELRLFNNTILESITNDSFASLTKIKGAFNVAGDIANFTLPKLTLVAGDFSLISTNEDFDCSPFNKLHSSSSIQGHDYTCTAPSSSSSSASSTKTSSGSKSSGSSSSSASSSSSSSSSSKKSDAPNNLLSASMVFMTLVGTVITFFL